jgi:spore germination protein KC
MRKKMILLILFILLAILLTGCWDARELNELGISMIMGFDIEDEKVLLTVEVIQPMGPGGQDGNGNNLSVKYVQGTGNNILEALRDIILRFDRRIFASHNKILIFGEDFAKKGLASHIDELYRDREQREMAYILVAKGQKAYDVMGINVGLEKAPADYVLQLVKGIRSNPKTVNINLVEYLKHYYHQGHHPVAGVIEKKIRKKIDKTSGDSGMGDYELSVMGAAVFKEEGLVGYLGGNDTKSLNFIMDNITGGIITFPTPPAVVKTESETKPENRDLSSVIIINNKTKNDVEIIDGKIILKTKVKLRSSLSEVVGDIDISKEENIKEIEDACSKAIEVALKAAIKKLQNDLKLDIFGFGIIFHRKYPEQWKEMEKNWDEIFSEAKVEVVVETNIIRTGLINTPVNKIKGK